jgi:hypothetical protein
MGQGRIGQVIKVIDLNRYSAVTPGQTTLDMPPPDIADRPIGSGFRGIVDP